MKKITFFLFISFMVIGVYSQNVFYTKYFELISKLNNKLTKKSNSSNVKSINTYIAQSFEGTAFPPSGWTKQNPTGGTGWARKTAGSTVAGWVGANATAPAAQANGGNAYAIANFPAGSNTSHTINNQWLISPGIAITTGFHLKFDILTYGTITDSLFVMISTSNVSLTSFTDTVLFLASGTISANTWVPYDIDLTPFSGQTIYVAFNEKITNNLSNGTLWALDLVSIENTPTIDAAVQSIDIPNLNPPVTITPMATVSNLGLSPQTFTVTMTIAPGTYTSTQNITSLTGGTTQQVSFAPFTGTNSTFYTVSVATNLSGDINNSNDTASKVINVWQADPVLFDNTAIAKTNNGVPSTKYGGLSNGHNLVNAADDFIVPSNTTWYITSIYTNGFTNLSNAINGYGVYIYSDNNGKPGSILQSDSVALTMELNNLDTSQSIRLNNTITLIPGKYWLSVFAIYDTVTLSANGVWGWFYGTTLAGDSAQLENTSGLFAGNLTWSSLVSIGLTGGNSLYFQINGTYTTGINNNSDSKISICPNPSNGLLYIVNAENAKVIVYNLLGEIVKNTICNSSFNNIDLSEFSNGTYIVKVTSDKNVITKKINIIK